MLWPAIIFVAYAVVVVVLQVRHIRQMDRRADAQYHTDLYRERGRRAR
jgi:hypothetical protein